MLEKKKRKVVLYIATSLDGYIATKDESLEWLFKTEGEVDAGYSVFYETIDTILMRRRTYDWIKKKRIFHIGIRSVMYSPLPKVAKMNSLNL